MVLTKRHNDMMAEARKLGLNREDMNNIVGRLTEATSVFDDVKAMATHQQATIDKLGDLLKKSLDSLTESCKKS